MMSCDLPVTMPTPASSAHPRLAMLDEHTVLQVTGEETLGAVKVHTQAKYTYTIDMCLVTVL